MKIGLQLAVLILLSKAEEPTRSPSEEPEYSTIDDVLEITTPKQYTYYYLEQFGRPSVVEGKNITFRVKARHDAHVTLSTTKGDWLTDSYEIVIGGWNNARSVIRKCHQCNAIVEYFHNPLDENYFMPFWITWKDSIIRVGKGLTIGHDEFLRWEDIDPHPINHVGISTGWGARGIWVFGSVDGGWSTWSTWTPCSASCEGGVQHRSRVCDNPRPLYGKDCEGQTSEKAVCNSMGCAVDGEWNTWTPWSGCSASCGEGRQVRERACDNPQPKYGGLPCPGTSAQHQTCIHMHCPVDGGWTIWTSWTTCTELCGYGTRDRWRECSDPAPQHGGDSCEGVDTQTLSCFLKPCAVDGDWSSWREWEQCSVTCGGGFHVRRRFCDNPEPQHGGATCPGSTTEQEACNTKHCPINGVWSSWESWHLCSKTCGQGYQRRQRYCDSPTPAYGGNDCMGDDIEEQDCNEADCRVDGQWSSWQPWSDCSVSCGYGHNFRFRLCNNPPAEFGGRNCSGLDYENKECVMEPCEVKIDWSEWTPWTQCSVWCGAGSMVRTRWCVTPQQELMPDKCNGSNYQVQECLQMNCPIDGNWTNWSEWNECSQTCDGGTRQRMRNCSWPEAQFGGQDCRGNDTEIESCNWQNCPVDGGLSTWGGWSPCSVSCGEGHRYRQRLCTNPRPAYGGLICSGQAIDYSSCSSQPCAVNGSWTEWTEWTSCSTSCGNGTSSRGRWCVMPEPAYGGEDCPGEGISVVNCMDRYCPIDGNWTRWSAWSECSASCAGGTRERERNCTFPAPQYGGRDCFGQRWENDSCNVGECPVDSSWDPWGSWTACTVTCGGGTKYRERVCTIRRENITVFSCPGESSANVSCSFVDCPVKWWAPTERVATEAPGAVGIMIAQFVVLGIMIFIIILMDLHTIYKHLKIMRRNLRDFRSTIKVKLKKRNAPGSSGYNNSGSEFAEVSDLNKMEASVETTIVPHNNQRKKSTAHIKKIANNDKRPSHPRAILGMMGNAKRGSDKKRKPKPRKKAQSHKRSSKSRSSKRGKRGSKKGKAVKDDQTNLPPKNISNGDIQSLTVALPCKSNESPLKTSSAPEYHESHDGISEIHSISAFGYQGSPDRQRQEDSEIYTGSPKPRSSANPRQRSPDAPNTHNILPEISHNRSRDRSRDSSRDRSRDRYHDRLGGRHLDSPHGRSQETHREYQVQYDEELIQSSQNPHQYEARIYRESAAKHHDSPTLRLPETYQRTPERHDNVQENSHEPQDRYLGAYQNNKRHLPDRQYPNAHKYLDSPFKYQVPPVMYQDSPIRHQDALIRQQDSPVRQQDPLIRQQDPLIRQQDPLIRQQDSPLRHQDAPLRHQDAPLRHQDAPLRHQDFIRYQDPTGKYYSSPKTSHDWEESPNISPQRQHTDRGRQDYRSVPFTHVSTNEDSLQMESFYAARHSPSKIQSYKTDKSHITHFVSDASASVLPRIQHTDIYHNSRDIFDSFLTDEQSALTMSNFRKSLPPQLRTPPSSRRGPHRNSFHSGESISSRSSSQTHGRAHVQVTTSLAEFITKYSHLAKQKPVELEQTNKITHRKKELPSNHEIPQRDSPVETRSPRHSSALVPPSPEQPSPYLPARSPPRIPLPSLPLPSLPLGPGSARPFSPLSDAAGPSGSGDIHDETDVPYLVTAPPKPSHNILSSRFLPRPRLPSGFGKSLGKGCMNIQFRNPFGFFTPNNECSPSGAGRFSTLDRPPTPPPRVSPLRKPANKSKRSPVLGRKSSLKKSPSGKRSTYARSSFRKSPVRKTQLRKSQNPPSQLTFSRFHISKPKFLRNFPLRSRRSPPRSPISGSLSSQSRSPSNSDKRYNRILKAPKRIAQLAALANIKKYGKRKFSFEGNDQNEDPYIGTYSGESNDNIPNYEIQNPEPLNTYHNYINNLNRNINFPEESMTRAYPRFSNIRTSMKQL